MLQSLCKGRAVANVFLRVPDELKAEIEAAAASTGRSLNAWVIQVLREALSQGSQSDDSSLQALETRVQALESIVLAHPWQTAITVQAAPPIPTPGSSPKPLPPEIPEGGDRLSDSALRRRWANAGSFGTFQDWAASQGWQRYGTGNRAVWVRDAN